MIPVVLFVLKDYDFFGLAPIFYGLIFLRIGAILGYTWLIYKLGKAGNHNQYDKYVFAAAVIAIITASLTNSPVLPILHFYLLDMSIIAVIYTIIPTKLLNQLILGTLFTPSIF
jgi:hypothetical protein